MANVPEEQIWEAGIYQIETTDPVIGGAPNLATKQGVPNIPNQQLANRTLFLKAAVDALQAASPGYATPADIAAAIDALVAGAPAALDTLNELAVSLQDNDDDVAALVAALAGKLDAAAYTAADILAKLLTVDGAGSELDADRLDGQHGSYYQPRSAALTALSGGSVETGIVAASVDDGPQAGGTYTPSPVGGNFRKLLNNGTFTLTAPTVGGDYTMVLRVANDATAGAITLSGFDAIGGEDFSITDGDVFFAYITKCDGLVDLVVRALQ